MSCGCNQNRGGRLGRLRGPALATGSTFKVGLRISGNFNSMQVIDELEGCLYQTGYFTSLAFAYSSSLFSPGYLLVEGVTAGEFGNVEDVGDLIAGQLQLCANNIEYKGRDRITYTPPASVVGNQTYGQGQQSVGNVICPTGTYYDSGVLGIGAGCKPAGGTPGDMSNKSLVDQILPSTKDGKGLLLFGAVIAIALFVKK